MSLKSFLLCMIALVVWNILGAENINDSKKMMVWVAIESPPKIWENGYGEAFPADYIFKNLAEAGFTDVEFLLSQGRGPENFYCNTGLANVQKCTRMGDRDWLEDALAAADKYNLKMWIILTPSYKVEGTDMAGFNDPHHIKLWTDIIRELGEKYKPRHKSFAGVYLHEFHCATVRDIHADDVSEFSGFCLKNFGEKYNGNSIPTGKDGSKWDRRFCLYKNDIMNNFVKIMHDTAAEYGMKSIFCLYPPETFASDSGTWGYDIPALEKICDSMWVVIQSDYRDLKGAWLDTGPSYKGANIPYRETMAFHGKNIAVFNFRDMLFPDVVRKAYKHNKKFTQIFGDYYNGYSQKSDKVIELFTGLENVKKWNSLQKEWTGAGSEAKIAVMASSVPFVLRYPSAPGVEYKKVFRAVLDNLKKHYAADAQVIGTEFTLKPENLAKYDLVIIPEEMGIGADEKFYETLKAYLANGGKVLALRTPLTTGSSDLEKQTDHTEEIFGVKIKEPAVEAVSADEIIIDGGSGHGPVMTRKGNAYYFSGSYDEKIMTDFIDKTVPQPARLTDNDNFLLSSIVRNGNTLCLSLPCEKAASAILSVDAAKLGIKSDMLEVRNIITGKVLYSLSPSELEKGVKIKTDYDCEPYVLAIGPEKDLVRFRGLYPDNKVFADMGKIEVVENPEVAIEVPDKPGIKVGIYQNAWGAETIYNALGKMPEFNCFYLPRLDAACMNHADVIVVPHARSKTFFENAEKIMKEMVKNGKGLVLTHDSAMQADRIFPDIADKPRGKIMKRKDNGLKILNQFDETASVKNGDAFLPGFAYDHYALAPGKNARVIAKDNKNNDVVIAGDFEKGKVVLFGTLVGEFSAWDSNEMQKRKKLEGKELQLLKDAITWLASRRLD